MDTRESNLAWIIAGVLFVLLVVVGYLWYSSTHDLDNVLQDGQEDIGYYRDQIAQHCRGPEADAEQCAEDMEALSDLLREFSAEIDSADESSLDANAEAQTN